MQDSQSQSALIQLQGVGRAFDTDAGRVHALAAGLLSGILPARRASRLGPVAALSAE